MKKNNSVHDCKLVSLPKKKNGESNITIIENSLDINFNVKRIYFLYKVPEGESRGGHAHYELEQYLIAGSGSFDVILFDGFETKLFNLNSPNIALNIKPGIWRELVDFSSGSVCLVLASEKYYEKDYMRDKNQFIEYKKNEKNI